MHCVARLLLLLSVLIPGWTLADTVEQARITIIIDDLGYNLNGGQRAIALPGPVTYAVIPYSPHSRRLAEQAHQQGKEVMLHMPMDNSHGREIGAGGLTIKQNRASYEERLQRAIASTPHISGLNNHMGSRLTADSERMQWLMQVLKQYPLYFVDSRTSAKTVAATTASSHHIPTLERDIFLDHEANVEFIDRQFKKLIKVARKQGSAVAIGHPYPSTLAYLEKALPRLDAMGIQLVSPSTLLALKNPPAATVASAPTIATTTAPNPEHSESPKTQLAKAAPVTGNRCRIIELPEVTRVNCS